ncbi:hypothetical protein LINPERPRIM_LOCUS21474, partial [Linum perenne]
MHKAETPHKIVSSSTFFIRPFCRRAMVCLLALSFSILASFTIFLPMVSFFFSFILCIFVWCVETGKMRWNFIVDGGEKCNG